MMKMVSIRSANWIIAIAWTLCAILVSVELLPLAESESAAGRALAGAALLAILCSFGVTFAALMVYHRETKTWRDFFAWVIDVAAMPLVVSILLVVILGAGQRVAMLLAVPAFGNRLGGAIGFEVGSLAAMTAAPYVAYLWPLFHRIPTCRSGGHPLALPTWAIAAYFVMWTTVIIWTDKPSLPYSGTYCLLWLAYCGIYHQFLRPKFPRYNWIVSLQRASSAK